MGYEVIYHYHERKDGRYNTEETKTIKKKIGDMYDEGERDKLAIAILGQLARRDIMVVDVEVFEYTKKKLTFKEIEGGIKLGNKKYTLSETATLVTAEETPQPSTAVDVVAVPPSVVANNQGLLPHEIMQQQNGLRRPIKYVRYEPSGAQIFEAKRKQLKFTDSKIYPVFREKDRKTPRGEYLGNSYLMLDDLGREIEISDEYFVPAQSNLTFDRELNFSKSEKNHSNGDGLLWSGEVGSDDMLDIRG